MEPNVESDIQWKKGGKAGYEHNMLEMEDTKRICTIGYIYMLDIPKFQTCLKNNNIIYPKQEIQIQTWCWLAEKNKNAISKGFRTERYCTTMHPMISLIDVCACVFRACLNITGKNP